MSNKPEDERIAMAITTTLQRHFSEPSAARILRAAEAAHEANRKYCLGIGDESQPLWADAPDWQKTSIVAGVRAFISDPDMTPKKSHEGWLEGKRQAGWTYGPVKDVSKKQHPCFVPYEDLPEGQQGKDKLFISTVREALSLSADRRSPTKQENNQKEMKMNTNTSDSHDADAGVRADNQNGGVMSGDLTLKKLLEMTGKEYASLRPVTVGDGELRRNEDCEKCEGCDGCRVSSGCANCTECSHCLDCAGCMGCGGCTICRACTNCLNCTECSHCLECGGCTGCGGCKGCVKCSTCASCTNCRSCEECTWCEECTNCVGCGGCTKCLGCTNCESCDGCTKCLGCSNCTGCEDCTDCTNCTVCEGCTNCAFCRSCKSCHHCTNSSSCLDCVDCTRCTNCTNCRTCANCKNCKNCMNCTNCVGIVSGSSLQYVAYGIQLTEEQWNELIIKRGA